MRVVLCTCPPAEAERIARGLLENGAGCVNVLPGVRSFYRWQGALQVDEEALLVIKAGVERLPALQAALETLHPYELPEWVVLPVDEPLTSPAYRSWVRGEGP
jgi:periplasmic divalent cation tolerance protein